MNKKLLGVIILTTLLTCPSASEAYAGEGAVMGMGTLASQANGDGAEATLPGAAGGALVSPTARNAVDRSQTQQKFAQQQQSPPYAPPPRPQQASPGEWVEVARSMGERHVGGAS